MPTTSTFNPYRQDLKRVPLAEFQARFKHVGHKLRLDKVAAKEEFKGDTRIELVDGAVVMTHEMWDLMCKGFDGKNKKKRRR